jgi:hypothetical protein
MLLNMLISSLVESQKFVFLPGWVTMKPREVFLLINHVKHLLFFVLRFQDGTARMKELFKNELEKHNVLDLVFG